jgi:glutathione peroxidase
LVILGFPANNFGAQEPGNNEEIKHFCTSAYGVKFPLFSKLSVTGDDIHPLYAFLTGENTNPRFHGEIRWNFAKFLIDRSGKVINRFDPKVKPGSEEIIRAIEAALSGN